MSPLGGRPGPLGGGKGAVFGRSGRACAKYLVCN